MLSNEILVKRSGNFSSSENHKLMAGWDEPEVSRDFEGFEEAYSVMKPLYDRGQRKFLVGEMKDLIEVDKVTGPLVNATLAVIKSENQKPPAGLVTYAEEKALETLFFTDPSLGFSTSHTRNGEEREADAVFLFKKETGLNITATGDNQIHLCVDEVGCTPDGLLFDDMDLVRTGLEVKCKSPTVHAKNLLVNDNKTMMEYCFEHYVQVQTAMLVTGASHWYFANFNPFAIRDDMRFKAVCILRDDFFIGKLKQRIEIAKRIKRDYLKKFLVV